MLPCSKQTLRGVLAAGLLLALPCAVLRSQSVTPRSSAALRHVSVEDFRAHVVKLQAIVQACGAQATACDAKAVGDDELVDAKENFQMRWQWLRNTLDEAKAASAARRGELIHAAAARLDETLHASGQPAVGVANFATARADADRILRSAEFDAAPPPSWLDLAKAKFWFWVQRHLSGIGELGAAWPWVGKLLEWLLFGGAAIGLLVSVRSSLRRQRLAVALNAQGGELAWKRDSTDWAMQAESSARNGDWRDAVHCLYWATIVMLEGRWAWRHNPARTPREYVRLLKPGSAQRSALRGLTQIFERLWYGLRDADLADYEKARLLYESLRDNSSAGAA